MPEKLDRGQVDGLIDRIHDLRRQLGQVQPEEDVAPSEEIVSERLVIDRLDDLLLHLDGALEDWRDILQERWKREPGLTLNFHRDLRAAWINGLRAFLAVSATGAFWIASAWSHGPLALVFVSVLMSVISSQPHPDRVGWIFFKAGAVGLVFALILQIPGFVDGFRIREFLTLMLGLFLFPLGLVMANPATTAPTTAFAFVFMSLVQPANLMVYDLAETLNSGLATLLGILFGTLAYILVFPPDPQAARRYVTYRIRRGLELLTLIQPVPATSSRWETRMYDRVIRLNDPQNLSATPTDEWLDAGLGALTLGNEILRLRRWLETEKLSTELAAAVKKTIEAFSRFLPEPQYAVAEVKNRREQLMKASIQAPVNRSAAPGRASWEPWWKSMFPWRIIRDSPIPKKPVKLCSRKSISTVFLSRLSPDTYSSRCFSLFRCASSLIAMRSNAGSGIVSFSISPFSLLFFRSSA